MSYKFKKVYPNNPIINRQIASPITENNESEKSSIWRSVKRFFRKKWLNFLTTVVLILTLWVYIESNNLNRKALIISHTPWLSINLRESIVSAKDNNLLMISCPIENRSDTPAFNICGGIKLSPSTRKIPAKFIKDEIGGVIMPHETVYFGVLINVSDYTFPNMNNITASAIEDAIRNGTIEIQLFLSYDNIFSEKISERLDYTGNTLFTGFDLKKFKIDGFTKY